SLLLIIDVAFSTQQRSHCSNEAQPGGEVKHTMQANHKWGRDQIWKEAMPQEIGLVRCWQIVQHVCRKQRRHRIVAQEGGKEGCGGWQKRDCLSGISRDSSLSESIEKRRRQRRGQSGCNDAEENADTHQGARVLERRTHTRCRTTLLSRNAIHYGRGVWRGEHALTKPQQENQNSEPDVVKVGGQCREQQEA